MTTTDSKLEGERGTAATSGSQAADGGAVATGAETVANGSARGAAHTSGRAGNIALWVLQVLLALMFLFAGAGKLAGEAQTVALFNEIGWGDWFRYVTGVVEIAGAIGLLIPRLAGLAALGLVGVMIGATVTELALGHPVIGALVPGVVVAVVAWGRRSRTAELVRRLRSR